MFREEIDMAGNAAKKKIQFLRQQTGAYFISAMLAGMFVGFGVLLAFTAGGMLKEGGVPGVKFIMGQGQKQSRFIAWTFMNDEQRRRFVNRQR